MFELIKEAYSFPFYPICFAYCVWKIQRKLGKSSLDGVVGANPAAETYMALALAPILGPVDALVSAFVYLRNK